jgi:hypothetical protein
MADARKANDAELARPDAAVERYSAQALAPGIPAVAAIVVPGERDRFDNAEANGIRPLLYAPLATHMRSLPGVS